MASDRFSIAPTDEDEFVAHRRVAQRRGREHARIGLNLTAMIDVVFLLLIYFIVATKFKLGEEVYRLDLPERLASNQPADPFELPDEPLRIALATTGLDRDAYVLRLEGAAAQPRTFEDLSDYLQQNKVDSGGGGLYRSDHPIIIEPSMTTTWAHTVEAFNAAVRARYTNIIFAKPQ